MADFQIRDPFQFLTPITGNILKCKAGNCHRSVAIRFRSEYQGRRVVILDRDPRGRDFDQEFYGWTLKAVCSHHRKFFEAKENEAAAFRQKVNSVLEDMKVVFEDEVSNYLPRIAGGLESLNLPYQVQICVLNSYHKRIEEGRNLTLDHRLEPNVWTESHSMRALITAGLKNTDKHGVNVYILIGKPLRLGAPPLVKIGSSKNNGDVRKNDVRKCRFDGSETQDWTTLTFKSLYGRRVEALIHGELLRSGYGVYVDCSSHNVRHQEFFEVDSDIVVRATEHWIAWIEKFRPYERNGVFRASGWDMMTATSLSSDVGNDFLLNSRGVPWYNPFPDYIMPGGECACESRMDCLKDATIRPQLGESFRSLPQPSVSSRLPLRDDSDDDRFKKTSGRKRPRYSRDGPRAFTMSTEQGSDNANGIPLRSGTQQLKSPQSTPCSSSSMPSMPSDSGNFVQRRSLKRRASSFDFLTQAGVFESDNVRPNDWVNNTDFF